MKRSSAPILIGLLISCFASSNVFAADDQIVKPELVANTTVIQPGHPFQLGVRLTIKPGWHIYWLNPGESGRATTVQVKAPEGFEVGPLQYPVPSVIPQPNNVIGYGYETEAFFTVTITPPKGLELAKNITIDLRATWLSCLDVCIMGNAPLSITLPVAADARPDNQAIFSAWRDRLAQPDVSQLVKTTKTDAGLHCEATVSWQQMPSNITFFPGPMNAAEIESLKIDPDPQNNAARLTFDIVPRKGLKLKQESLFCLIRYESTPGDVRALSFNVSLKELIQPGK